MVIEEEAYPFEERAIEVHEANFELLAGGVYNAWVQRSLDQLALLMPGRYAKNELSGGYLDSIDSYAYRMPIAPPPGIDESDETQNLTSAVELEEVGEELPRRRQDHLAVSGLPRRMQAGRPCFRRWYSRPAAPRPRRRPNRSRTPRSTCRRRWDSRSRRAPG